MRVRNAVCSECGKTSGMHRVTKREGTGEIIIVHLCGECMRKQCYGGEIRHGRKQAR